MTRPRMWSTSCFRLARPVEGGLSQRVQTLVYRLTATFDEPVRVEDDRRSDGQVHDRLGVAGVRPRTEREATPLLDELRTAVGVEHERRRMTCGRDAGHARLRVDDDVHKRREGRLDHLLGQAVEARHRRRRLHAVERERTQGVPQLRHRRGRLDALSHHVADDEPQAPVGEVERVEPVATDVELRRSGEIACGELHAFDARQRHR